MRVVSLFTFDSVGGDAFQARVLAKHINAILVNSVAIRGGETGAVPIYSKSYGEIYYPVNSIFAALERLKPDIVLVHTVTPDIIDEIHEIVKRYIVAYRVGINFEESYLIPEIRSYLVPFLNFMDKVDCLICPSEHVKRNLNTLGYRNTVVIPTAVNPDHYVKCFPIGKNILMAGRIGVVKNHLIPVLSMKKIQSEVPDAKMFIFGDGALKDYLTEVKDLLNLSPVVELPGFQDLKRTLPLIRVFLQPSLSENMAITVIEALASGVPVVASNIPGHRVGKSIIYVDHDDVDGFAEQTIRLLVDDTFWYKKHKEALMDAAPYHVQTVKRRYEELFETLLKLKKFKELSR